MKNAFSHTEIAAKVKHLRLTGHKLSMTWSGEYGVESSSTGHCACGEDRDGQPLWQESASNQQEVRWEYKCHLAYLIYHQEMGRLAKELGYDDFEELASDDDWGLLRIRCKLDQLKVGEVKRLSAEHWIARKAKNVYITTFINLVGGQVSNRFAELDKAYQQVTKDNQDMIRRGRIK